MSRLVEWRRPGGETNASGLGHVQADTLDGLRVAPSTRPSRRSRIAPVLSVRPPEPEPCGFRRREDRPGCSGATDRASGSRVEPALAAAGTVCWTGRRPEYASRASRRQERSSSRGPRAAARQRRLVNSPPAMSSSMSTRTRGRGRPSPGPGWPRTAARVQNFPRTRAARVSGRVVPQA